MRCVLYRVFLEPEVPAPAAGERDLLALASELVPKGKGWEWNQALMELGALQCTARRPLCGSCPVARDHLASASITDALSAATHAPKKPAPRYEGSNRYYRGRALVRLREAPEGGVTLRDLGAALRDGFADRDLPWVESIARSLQKDGLSVLTETIRHRARPMP